MECLDANAVQDLMSGSLDDSARRRVTAHLDTCADCRELVSLLAKQETSDVGLDETLAPEVGLDETVAGDTASIGPTKPYPIRIEEVGRKLGRYTLLERLGQGAMGVVYRAEDPELGRKVALKLLHRPDAMFTERLVREARSMAQVNHPNVVAVYDVGVADGATYIAMELVTGTSLRKWLETPRTIPEIARAFVEAGRGLAAAHAAGIVHRDFKPDNCLVGDDGRVRVTDFGLASARKSDSGELPSGDLSLTTDGTVLGTPAYMAPEQFVGGNVDSRTDQFNFAVSLFEALYGRRPFTGKTYQELGDNVCEGKIRTLPADTRVSRAIHAIVMRGLSTKPGDRFPTMDALVVELRRDRAKPWRRTSIVAAVVSIVLALGLVADLVTRDRVAGEIRQAFQANGRQVERAMRLLTDRFEINANQVYNLPIMRDVAGHRDNDTFGLGDSTDDAQDLVEIHEKLKSQDWKWMRQVGDKQSDSILAVGDRLGHLVFTSADGDRWKQDLHALPWVERVLVRGRPFGLSFVRADDPALVASGLLGPHPPTGLLMFFTRTLLLAGETASLLVQVIPAVDQIKEIRIDDTMISLVGPDTSVGDVPPALALAVAHGAESVVVERREAGTTYELLALPIHGYDNEVVGQVVLARPKAALLSLFPGARIVFTILFGAAVALALATRRHAHRITHARA